MCVCLDVCLHVYAWMYVCICIFIYVCDTCIYSRTPDTDIMCFIYMYMSSCMCTYMCSYVCVYVTIHLFMYIYIYMCVYMCLYMRICGNACIDDNVPHRWQVICLYVIANVSKDLVGELARSSHSYTTQLDRPMSRMK